jgi:nucleotide-binding universal stress UspA family protein
VAGWRKICCAIDFSKSSRAALREAADLARQLDAELTLVHIHETLPVKTVDAVSAARLLQPAAEQLRRTLDDWRADAERILKCPARVAVFSGSPAAELVRFARANRFDAIVVGAHGRAGDSRAVLGSVAERVVRGARCHVVVVQAEAAARGMLAATASGTTARVSSWRR